MSEVKIHKSPFDSEAEFFCEPQPSTKPMLMRYDVLLHDQQCNPFIGKVVTSLTIQKWCELNGYILGVLQSKGPARKDETTELL